jgi:hypothetical protein
MRHASVPLFPQGIIEVARQWQFPAEKLAEIAAELVFTPEDRARGAKDFRPGSFSSLMLREAGRLEEALWQSQRATQPDHRQRQKYHTLQRMLDELAEDASHWGFEDRARGNRLWYQIEQLQEGAPRLGILIEDVLKRLPPPRSNRHKDSEALRQSITRLRAIYKYVLRQEPGKGQTPFAKGVHTFFSTLAPDYNRSLTATVHLIVRTLR